MGLKRLLNLFIEEKPLVYYGEKQNEKPSYVASPIFVKKKPEEPAKTA